ncbi:MAG: 4-hydroxythreonine-4-phosphate dehydrogenase PdxA, partial [Rhodospirillaceae bacterium]|nr:4-hydroxythreonine-4-phosphate dehydrogenase PdxA [Rhodospirillaceae bacterium]
MTLPSPLALTMGEPAGIGGDITIKAWANKKQNNIPAFFVIDDPERLRSLARRLRVDIPIKEIRSAEAADKTFSEALPVLSLGMDVRSQPGRPSEKTVKAVIRSIETAVKLVMSKSAGAVVTNPISKETLITGGFEFPG